MHERVAGQEGADLHSRERPMKATYDDVLNAPENKVAEILDGELFLSPRPAPPHAVSAGRLMVEIGAPFDRGRGGPGGWWILPEPELHLAEHIVVPDLAGWRRDRMAHLPDEAYFTLPPDWVCEVLSPSTARIDRTRKLRIYREARVGHAWLVDPLAKSLEVFRLSDAGWLLVDAKTGATPVRIEPFDAIELELGALWPDAGVPAGSE